MGVETMAEVTIGLLYLDNAIVDGHAKIMSKGHTQRINYIAAYHS